MRLLIIGASGFIGHAASRALRGEGHEIVGMARRTARARRTSPDVFWVEADPLDLQTEQDWEPHLKNIDAVLYVSRAEEFEERRFLPSFQAMLAAAEKCQVRRLVKLTGTGLVERSGDRKPTSALISDLLQGRGLEWVILRPGLVIGPGVTNSQGLLRLGASLPGFLPQIDMGSRVQTIALSDLMVAISEAVNGQLPGRCVFDLVEDEMWTPRQLAGRFRSWLGLPKVHRVVRVPDRVLGVALFTGNLLERFGWRTPLGSRALGAMLQGVEGDPGEYMAATGRRLLSFDEALNQVPATTQERWYTRFAILFPLILLFMSAFLVAAGVHGILHDRMPLMSWSGLDPSSTFVTVLCHGLQILWLLLGIGILNPRFSALCSTGILGLCLLYVAAGLMPLPVAWGAPDTAMMTMLPLMLLALLVKLMMESR